MVPPPDRTPHTVGSIDDRDFMMDLGLIARRQPGRGQALQRILDRVPLTQTALAELLNLNRSTVTYWCQDKRWPTDVDMRSALLKLNVDRKALRHAFGPALAHSDADFDPQLLAVTVVSHLFDTDDPFAREIIIFTSIAEKVLIAHGIKALTDIRSAEFFFERYDKHLAERERRAVGHAVEVTPRQAQWLTAGVPGTPLDTVDIEPSVSSDPVSGNTINE